MSPARAWSAAIAAGVAGLAAGPVWAQNPVYTRVKMSLTVPWTLYFVFLACVLIPFIVMIVLAWRRAPHPEPEPKATAIDEPASGAP